ncbi:MAG: topoisomerase C-terminal repeat-containing protein, partial [Silvanigrellaceae bacterium]|nr:topoisomerase C-terminal repeat-containing protein [Silvanigrellaceae bacterium]
CRSECDWLIGMNATRAVTKRLKTKTSGVWSVGRVQTPTLALVVKRELEYLKHRPESYWTIEGRFSTPTHEYSGLWFDPAFKKVLSEEDDSAVREKEDRIFDAEKLKNVLQDFAHHKAKAVASETRKESREIAPQLFDLTLLQREANRRFGVSASRTLQAAQRLYERHKLLTYPRTDSKYLPEDYVDNVKDIIKGFAEKLTEYKPVCKKILSSGLLNKERVFNNKFVSDHFAIIPTGLSPSEKLDGDDARIFDLVLKRFLSAFMPPAVWAKVERLTQVGAQSFRTRVQDLQIPGWREVYGLDTQEESKLPALNFNSSQETKTPVEAIDISQQQNVTKPPPRLTEAKLLSLMEHCGKSVADESFADALKDKGIGTPATRSEIIENLILKEYVSRVGKSLQATSKGIRLVDILTRIPVDNLSKVELTGEMEFELRLMEKGQKKRSEFMNKMSDFTTVIVDKTRTFEYDRIYSKESPLGSCPVCQQPVVESFWGYQCKSAKGDCKFIIWKEKNRRYIDSSVVTELFEKKIAGPLEFFNPAGTSTYHSYVTLSSEKGIVFCDENGNLTEISHNDVTILREEFLQKTFLNLPGTIKETEVAYLCEFSQGESPVPAMQVAPEVMEGAVPSVDKAKKTKKKAKASVGDATKVKKAKKAVAKKINSRMPKVLCGRPISFEEYKSFIITGATEPITDFVSKKGRKFAASLHLKTNGNFEFKFVSRKALLSETGEVAQPKPKKIKGSKAKVVKKVAAL